MSFKVDDSPLPEDTEEIKRLRGELHEELDEIRDLFDEADFIRDLMTPLEIHFKIKGSPFKVLYRRLTSSENEDLRVRLNREELEADDIGPEIVIEMIHKARPSWTRDKIRSFLKDEIPAAISALIGREAIMGASVFLTEPEEEDDKEPSTTSLNGSDSPQTPSEMA